MEKEKVLRDETERKEKAESRLFQLQKSEQSGVSQASEEGLLVLANQELIKKGKQIKELTRKLEIYEGRNLENFNKADLQKQSKALQDVLKRVNQYLDNKAQ